MGVSTTHRINLSMWILIYSFSDTYYVWAACGASCLKVHFWSSSLRLAYIYLSFVLLVFFSGNGGSGKTFSSQALVQHLMEQAGGGLESDICKVCVHFSGYQGCS